MDDCHPERTQEERRVKPEMAFRTEGVELIIVHLVNLLGLLALLIVSYRCSGQSAVFDVFMVCLGAFFHALLFSCLRYLVVLQHSLRAGV